MRTRLLSELLVSGAALAAAAPACPGAGTRHLGGHPRKRAGPGPRPRVARASQGPQGNWESNDLGLVSTGMLAFLAAGHRPGIGRYGENLRRSQDYVLRNAQPSGLLNVAEPRRGMYNHGLSTFVLGQLYGMSPDPRISPVLDRALKLIAQTQCEDGGWDYVAQRQPQGHDLSLAVMQALALRSAVDIGLEVPPDVVDQAIKSVREHYTPQGCSRNAGEEEQKKHPGRFTYSKGGGQATLAMAAAGVVCLQEFAQYDDWRIEKNIRIILEEIEKQAKPEVTAREHRPPLRRLHLVLRGPSPVPGGRGAVEEGLPAAPRRRGGRADPRSRPSRAGRHVAGRTSGWAAGPASCT